MNLAANIRWPNIISDLEKLLEINYNGWKQDGHTLHCHFGMFHDSYTL